MKERGPSNPAAPYLLVLVQVHHNDGTVVFAAPSAYGANKAWGSQEFTITLANELQGYADCSTGGVASMRTVLATFGTGNVVADFDGDGSQEIVFLGTLIALLVLIKWRPGHTYDCSVNDGFCAGCDSWLALYVTNFNRTRWCPNAQVCLLLRRVADFASVRLAERNDRF